MSETADDPYLWLEDVTGERALEWVRARNAESTAELTGDGFHTVRDEIREVLDSADRIPYVRRRGRYLYNFWQDEQHVRGLWRRTTLDSYRTDSPDWQVLIDLDALADAEDENWVWQGASVLYPDYTRALVQLSRGGADASVVREFDLESGGFVPDGFTVPEAKTYVAWIDIERIYVGTDFGEGSLTESGYPRLVKLWRRGTPLAEAETVFEAKPEDVLAAGFYDPITGRHLINRRIDFYRSEWFLRTSADSHDAVIATDPGATSDTPGSQAHDRPDSGTDGGQGAGLRNEPGSGLVRIDVPGDADIDPHRDWLLVRTRSQWPVGGVTYPAGALLAARFDDYLAGVRDLTVLFEPDPSTALTDYTWTRRHLIVTTLQDVKSRLTVFTPGPDGWRSAPLPDVPEAGAAQIVDADPYDTDEYWLNTSGFTEPATLRRGEIGAASEVVKRQPAFFDASDMSVRQHFATSDDGTRIPYFVVEPADPTGPTLLTGYGGFEVPMTPSYSGVVGRGWLARGGRYVVANLRGGGEYGPVWHQSVLRENRFKVYQDMAAVARDVVERGLATPGRLGVVGGSNGGLLTGVMLTRYPSLFGAVVSRVPLLDMRRYHLLLAGASWMAEYGDPDTDDWEFLREYSPYHQVYADRTYPPALFTTSTRDDRVHPGHARKMVARMLEQGHDVRYYENIEGGHGAAANNEQLAFQWALMFEFLRRTLR